MSEQIDDPIDVDHLAEDLLALANSSRLALIRMLERPRYGEELATALGMTRQSALKHIQRLESRGFVRSMHGRRKSGPVIEYQTVPARIFAAGLAIQQVGRLTPSGGPQMRREEQTVSAFMADGMATESMMPKEQLPVAPFSSAAPEPGMAARLLFVSGPWAGRKIKLNGDRQRWTIGRADDQDIKVDHDPYVSNEHCVIQAARTGYEMVDIYSANGTRLNFANLPKGNRATLLHGDVVTVGHTSAVFQLVRS